MATHWPFQLGYLASSAACAPPMVAPPIVTISATVRASALVVHRCSMIVLLRVSLIRPFQNSNHVGRARRLGIARFQRVRNSALPYHVTLNHCGVLFLHDRGSIRQRERF